MAYCTVHTLLCVGNKLNTLLPEGGDPLSYMKEDVLNSMFLFLTNNEEVFNLINRLLKKSPGPDGITGYLLKMTQDVMIPVFTDLFNKCILCIVLRIKCMFD